ncbi:MAG: HAMP domain-containing sensor histidine kinase, partial [Candidatus Gribaldobacteria bacterium]|nr:HAMP domain-containing sensor histidine kinase [Candidatus Gribaldobacteria bacterium]
FWDTYELEGENMKMQPEKTDIAVIVERLIPEKQKLPMAIQRKLTISVNKPVFEIPAVWCDPKKITHVISNLLDNAVYYTEQGSVVVNYEIIDKKYLKIKVTDTGAGITQEDQKRLFKKFSRGHTASSLHPDGSGLGLYISKKIAESNAGEMTYESNGVSGGSTFAFTVPLYQNQQPNDSQKKQGAKRDKIVVFKQNNKVTNKIYGKKANPNKEIE